MIAQGKPKSYRPKIYFSHGLLPKYVDPKQLPAKEKPWSVVLQQRWSSTVELVLDEKLYNEISERLTATLSTKSWSRVTLPLLALLQGDFFNVYIKTGNISMLSQGRPGLDPLYTLHEGRLTLELPKELYERAGLVGDAIPDGGRKHVKTRFAVDLNLRQPSMVHGKKGFERIVWAFKNVLTEPVTWLFYDHCQSKTLETGTVPITTHNPATRSLTPTIARLENVLTPTMRSWSEDPERDAEDAVDLLDWFGMVSLNSPRISAADSVDSFLSRYQVPDAERATATNLLRLRWTGFIQGQCVRELLLECMLATKRAPRAWYAISAKAISQDYKQSCDGYILLRTQIAEHGDASTSLHHPEFLMWEMQACDNR